MPKAMNLPPNVEVRRSNKRRRTVSAAREGNKTVLNVPQGMSITEIEEIARNLINRMNERDPRAYFSDDELFKRAQELSATYLFAKADPKSVAWSTRLTSTWGICTPLEGEIRITSRLQGMPQYVLDYVLLHELVHLVINDHGKDFESMMRTFEKKERAEGYLDALDELPSSVWSSGSLGAIPAESNEEISRGA
ncbi:MAG: M48 family metallopeptidase [Actinomycetota bacterium]|nr:M48 family metallopeptidase [Actinomycetota bacterium]